MKVNINEIKFWKSPITETLYMGILEDDQNAKIKKEITPELFANLAREMGYIKDPD